MWKPLEHGMRKACDTPETAERQFEGLRSMGVDIDRAICLPPHVLQLGTSILMQMAEIGAHFWKHLEPECKAGFTIFDSASLVLMIQAKGSEIGGHMATFPLFHEGTVPDRDTIIQVFDMAHLSQPDEAWHERLDELTKRFGFERSSMELTYNDVNAKHRVVQ